MRAHVAHAGPEDAPPLVLLHGFPQHWYCWRKVIPLLSADFRILAMDTRGLGWSGPAGDYRKARIAEDAVALLDDLGIQRAGLAGHDWGGWAGFLAVLRAPERWTGYVAAGVAHPWQPPERMLRALPRLAYQPPLAMPLLGPRLIPRLVPAFHRAGWGDRSTFDDAAVEVFAATYREPARAQAGSRYYRDFLTREIWTPPTPATGAFKGQRLTVPTRLLFGTRDPLGRGMAAGLERYGEDARTEFLTDCGHFVPEERAVDVAATIREVCVTPPA